MKPDFVDKPVKALPGCYMHYVLHSYETGTFGNVEIDESIRSLSIVKSFTRNPVTRLKFLMEPVKLSA